VSRPTDKALGRARELEFDPERIEEVFGRDPLHNGGSTHG